MASDLLDDWHRRLADRFGQLRAERDAVRPGSPVFALEHGLSLDDDLPELQEAVRLAVLGPRLPESAGLPFVVYAAEIGYGYAGDKYWPVFEEATPNWTAHGIDEARRFIRHRFEEFADSYGGARISGRWALWFKNIAWPITHAVLSKDLQRHLARLLYDYRMAFTADLLEDHAALGERLAGRSQDTSARFRNFAENTELLGLVAAALLVGEDEDTPLLTPEVLHRIVSDLSEERQAGSWLLDAKRAAVRIRRKGWMRAAPGGGASPAEREGSERSIEATMSIRRTTEGWRGYVSIPSHEPLARRFPDLRAELERSRYRVHGVNGAQSRGALLYDRGPMQLDRWPSVEGRSLVELDTTTSGSRRLLADHCRMPAGPWLFRVAEPGVAVQVRTRTVRPSVDYLLVTKDGAQVPGVENVEARFATQDAAAICFRVPSVVDQELTDGLLSVGLSVAPEVSVGPAGVVPAAWDGEGLAEWPAGESPLLAVRSTHAVASCIVSTETEAREAPWPEGTDTLLLQVDDLVPGAHALDVVLLDEQRVAISQGRFVVVLSEPVDSASSTSARQGLQVRCFPPHPTLRDLWSGSSRLEVSGPEGERVQFEVLMTSFGTAAPLARAAFSSQLPVGEERWSELLRGAQGDPDLGAVFGEAEEMVVRVAHQELGTSEVRAGRPFEPLRWSTGHDKRGPYARLVNHTAVPPSIRYFPPDHPATPEDVRADLESDLRFERGGLVIACCGELQAGTILPPHVIGGLDALRLLNVRPTLQTGPRTVESIRRCISLARLWGVATAADATAEGVQLRVLGAICSRLGGLISGPHWWDVEHQLLDGASLTAAKVMEGVGRGADERRIAQNLIDRRRLDGADERSLEDAYVAAVATHCRWVTPDLAALVARLARAPETLDEDDDQVIGAVQAALDRPALFRLARLLVISGSMNVVDERSRRQ